jgi:cytochrome d ubiquinol oxidase subunit II
MFEKLTYLQLQQYWWILASLLGGILVFLMFVQGGQTLLFATKNNTERTLMINSIGRKWKLTFTTLVTFGGVMFAAFPLFYATSFGGAYWVWLLILFGFIIQAIAFDFRMKTGNIYGKTTYEIFLFINGLLGPILLGTAVGTFFTGGNFSINEYNLSHWTHPLKGLEAAFNFNNLALGLSVFFLARILAAMYFINNINNENILKIAKKQVLSNSIIFLVIFIYFLTQLFLRDGFAYNSQTKIIFIEPYKYLHNFLQMPLITIILLLGVIFILFSLYVTLLKNSKKGIWFAGIGTILAVFSLFISVGFNNTPFYPSIYDLQSSLSIENASSSPYTLIAMSYVSLIIPIVLIYIFYAWKSIDKHKINITEINSNNENEIY